MSTRSSRRLAVLAGAAGLVGLLAACGGSASPAATSSSASVSSSSSTTTPSPAAAQTPTVAQLQAAAAAVYPACVAPTCAAGAKFTTCDSGYSGQQGVMGDKLTTCPLSSRLLQQLETVTTGAANAPDALGGGQSAQFTSESFTATPSASGGTVHAVLTPTGGGATSSTDLVFVASGAKLLLDDVYCTGKDPSTTDAYTTGWLTRASCG